MWVKRATQTYKDKLLAVISEGRFEVAYPGYVMQDEGLPNIHQTTLNFLNGVTWLQNNLNISVKSAFTADPFGVSASCAYMHSLFNVSNLLVQRVNYRTKELLGSTQDLEFFWDTGHEKGNYIDFENNDAFKPRCQLS